MARTSWIFAFVLLLAAAPASGFEVTWSDEGLPLRWPAGAVSWRLEQRTAERVPALADAATAAFKAWAGIDGSPLCITGAAPVDDGFGYDPSRPNASVVRWEDREWDHDPDALMLTFVHYRVTDGAIVDADILINAVDHTWDAAPERNQAGEHAPHDLQNSLTHEAGHFLGLAHSPDHPEAVMYPTTSAGELSKRRLAADDVEGFSFLYLEAPLPGADGTGSGPRFGCAVAPAAGPWTGLGAGLIGLALLLAGARPRRARCRRRWWLVGGVSLILCSSPAAATSLRPLSLEALARGADVVVEGRVVATRSHRTGRLIVTDATVAVRRCLRGSCGEAVVVRQPGGEHAGVGLHVEGTARLNPREDVVLFLRRDGGGVLAPMGMAQGVFRVRHREGRAEMVRDLRAVVLVGGSGARSGRLETVPLAYLTSVLIGNRPVKER